MYAARRSSESCSHLQALCKEGHDMAAVCVCVCLCVCIYIYVYRYIYTNTCTQRHAYIHVYTLIRCVCVCVRMSISVCVSVCTYEHKCVCVCVWTLYTCMCTYDSKSTCITTVIAESMFSAWSYSAQRMAKIWHKSDIGIIMLRVLRPCFKMKDLSQQNIMPFFRP